MNFRNTGFVSAKAVFGPGTNIPEAAADLVEKLNAQLGYGESQAAE